ncbi:bifunctional DNA primase/polymerase [Streptomyces sp. NBC_01190]|uniref:bifunctional DNA primase/polymerase n=1 Tax=Streptomyces sp. NBC_01190 TaxID=2903767 RepID=UPI00386EDC0C|nr:bifunctional DNA primase/polymerase [Streptomyces sp. NBC_01190]
MVFTIGSMREIRETRQQRTGARNPVRLAALSGARPGVRRKTHAAVRLNVAEYAGLCGWAVVPGARAARGGGACSCGDAACPRPGAHPLAFAAEIPAGATLEEAAEAWARVPGAAVLLPVGRSFDIIDVAEAPGRHALVRLERMGLGLGPVLLTPTGRAQFFVAPGAAAELPRLLYRMGWDDTQLDLRCLGPGDHVTAPPSDLAGLGPVRWLREPLLGSVAQPPEARMLLGTLAYICHRDRQAYA